MVLTAHDMSDPEVDIVDRRRQHIEPRPVRAADDRIGQEFRIEFLVAAHRIVPFDRGIVIEFEAPVRRSVFREGRIGRGPFVNRRKPPAEQDLAAQLKLFRRLVTGIDSSRRLQGLKTPLIKVEAFGLALLGVPIEPKPAKIGPDPGDIFLFRPFKIGIVDAQDEAPAMLLRPQPIVKRRAHVANMEVARG